VARVGWKGKLDPNLLSDAARRGYDTLLTNDSGQLDNPNESQAIRDSGMHEIRYQQDTRPRPSGGSQAGPVAVMPLTEELLFWIATPVSKPVMVPGPVTTTPVTLEAMMMPWLATAAGT
jgi:hypothetical protein